MLRWYQMKLATRPYLTQSVTSAILFATGDTMAQQLIEKKGFRKHDAARTGRMALYGPSSDPSLLNGLGICNQE
ncbi:Protein sym1 [Golovinomyces cichoracearum]|uniref:Protein sym1 n=1 Tax=Golovinomyces cichoracearum TaxID=62708 RepID=A0A420I923_9PEZI|nr:Protein sym1 [Golovinomyces cichoracearum]